MRYSKCPPSARTHDIHAKSTQDLGFPRYHFQVHARSWISTIPFPSPRKILDSSRTTRGFPGSWQELAWFSKFYFFTNASITSQYHSKRQNFGSIALAWGSALGIETKINALYGGIYDHDFLEKKWDT